MPRDVYTVTLCEVGENHAGMQRIGTPVDKGVDIGAVAAALEKKGIRTEIVDLPARARLGNQEVPPGEVMVIRNGVNLLMDGRAGEEKKTDALANAVFGK